MNPADVPRPVVLLLTANYPYLRDGGETAFLAPEVEVLARQGLVELRVVPLRTAAQALPLPGGVSVDDSLAHGYAAARVSDLLQAWRWPGFGLELRRALRHGGPVGVARVWRWAAVARATARWLAHQHFERSVVAYSYWRGGQTLALARWAAAAGGRTALTRVHRYELYEDGFDPPFQPWVRVYDELQAVVTVAEHGRRYLLQRGVAAQRLVLARLGTAACGFARASDDGALRVVSCSFLRPVKRVPLLAQALRLLALAQPQLRVVWTHLGDGNGRAAVQAALADAPSNLQTVLVGELSNDEVRAFYAREPVDLFVQVSASEGLPVAVMEALSAGVPVVATDVGGTSEAVDAAVGHLLGANPSPAEVADAIAAVALHRTLSQRQALRQAARARWAERFDAQRNHDLFGRWLAQQAKPMPAARAGRA